MLIVSSQPQHFLSFQWFLRFAQKFGCDTKRAGAPRPGRRSDAASSLEQSPARLPQLPPSFGSVYSGPGETGAHGSSTLHNPLLSDRRMLGNSYKKDIKRRRPQPSGRICLFSAGTTRNFYLCVMRSYVDASHRPDVTTGVSMHSFVCHFFLFIISL
jgi:hypothetical protein